MYQVDGELFQVHSHIFERESEEANRLALRRNESQDGVVVLGDVTKFDFECFLTSIYCKQVIYLHVLS
jgi:hypothetical protein